MRAAQLIGAGLVIASMAACASPVPHVVAVHGQAMAPTFRDGQILTYDPAAYASTKPKRGDIVLVKVSGASRVLRVVGLPGETVTIQDAHVLINGAVLSEPYLAPDTATLSATSSFNVPEGAYFLLNDNRAFDSDSRSVSFVFLSQVVGRVNA